MEKQRRSPRARSVRDLPMVLSIHGIRTTGRWQGDLAEVLEQHGFRHRPLTFGFFRAMSLLIPWARQRKVDWFLAEIERKTGDLSYPPSIIAHSFGSYLVARALEKQPLLKFDLVILCGSIVRTNFPWSAIADEGQVSQVLNETGGQDFWSGVIGWVVSDAGPSGVKGFSDKASGRVVQIENERHRHSDYFSRLNYKNRWIPFLQGQALKQPTKRAPAGINKRFSSVVLVLLLLGITVGWSWWLETAKEPLSQGPGETGSNPVVTERGSNSASWNSLNAVAEETELHSATPDQACGAFINNASVFKSKVQLMSIAMQLNFDSNGRVDPKSTAVGIRCYDDWHDPVAYFLGLAQNRPAAGERSGNHVLITFDDPLGSVRIVGDITGNVFEGRVTYSDGKLLGKFAVSVEHSIGNGNSNDVKATGKGGDG